MTATAKVIPLFSIDADLLGELRAEIKVLQDKAQLIETELKTRGPGQYDGEWFTASVSSSERTTVDWKAVAAKLSPSHQLVTAHTKVKTIETLRLSAHKK